MEEGRGGLHKREMERSNGGGGKMKADRSEKFVRLLFYRRRTSPLCTIVQSEAGFSIFLSDQE